MSCVARLAIPVALAGVTATAASLYPINAEPASTPASGLPIDFIENKGQWEESTVFVARGPSVAARFERDSLVVRQQDPASAEVRLTFEGA